MRHKRLLEHLASGTKLNVLVLAPHTDDEMGCAGSVSKLLRLGAQVSYIAFSSCKESVPRGFAPETLIRECRCAQSVLGLPAESVTIWDYPVRRFNEHRQDILERLVSISRSGAPDLVFMPSTDDFHQDHQVVSAEGLRAFKHSSLLGYELLHCLRAATVDVFMQIEDEDLSRKLEAIKQYKSQEFRAYVEPDIVRGLAKVRGVQCGGQFAEAFQAIRLVL